MNEINNDASSNASSDTDNAAGTPLGQSNQGSQSPQPGPRRYRKLRLRTTRRAAFNRFVMGGIILLGVVALGVMRLLVGLDSLGQIYLTIFILLCAVAYQVVSRSTRDTSTVQKYDPGAIYESELTSLHQAAKEYSQEEVARFVKARFSQRDVETFQKNLTEAQENVLTWEFVVRQSGYLVLIETVTHGLDSAKKIIADIQQHPRKMLKFGDFLYTTLPNVTRLSTEFSDLTQNQAQARKAALVLIKKLSGDVTKMYEAAQLADVQEVVRESGATLAGDSMAESLASMKAEADASPSNDEFNIVQQALTEQGARGSAAENPVSANEDSADGTDSAAADSPKTSSAARPTIPVSRREIQQQRTLDALVAALVGGSLGAVWTPGVFAVFCAVVAFGLACFAVISGFRALRMFSWMMVVGIVVLCSITFVGYGQQVQRDAVAHAQGNGDESDLTVDEQMEAVSKEKAKEWTMEDFMALDINGTSGYGGTDLSDILKVYGAPGSVWGGDDGTRQVEYAQNPRTYNLTEASIDFSVVDGSLIDKSENGLGAQLPYTWTSNDCDSLVTLDKAKSWKDATSFAQVEAKHGDPYEVEVTREKDDTVSFFTAYHSDHDFQGKDHKMASLSFVKVAPDDYRLKYCWVPD